MYIHAKWYSWDISWAAWGWLVTQQSCRQYGTGMPPTRSKVFDSLLASSGIIADLLGTLQSAGSQLVVPQRERRVYWFIQTYVASCTVCLARKSPCPRRAPMGHVTVGRRWERVAMDLLEMSITSAKGNRYLLVMVDCFSRWTEACPLPDKTAISVESFNRTLLMILVMFAGEHKDDWDDLLPPVMMTYRSSVHESTGFSPYRLMFGEECTLPMDIGLPLHQPDPQEEVTSPYAVWVKDSLEVAFDQVRRHSGQLAVQRQKRLYDQRAVRRLFAIGDWVMRYYPAGKKCKLDSVWTGPYPVVAFLGWTVGIQKHPDVPVILMHCQDVKKVPQPSGVQTWIASTVAHTSRGSPSITALPPDEGVVLADVDSVRNERSTSQGRVSGHASVPSDDFQMASMSDSVSPTDNPFSATTLRIDDACPLYPFSVHKLDAGPVCLMTIVHAFNYRLAVLRDGVKPAVRVGRSRKAEGRFLSGSDISWGQQVAVMFRPGLVPFVSDRPGAYGRLLLTVYVRWRTGLLVSSDWLRPVTWGGWRAGFPDRGRGSADVS